MLGWSCYAFLQFHAVFTSNGNDICPYGMPAPRGSCPTPLLGTYFNG